MRNPEETRDTCVQCGREFDCQEDNGHEVVAIEEEEEEERDGAGVNVSTVEEENLGDVSGILADRMIHGWALLADHCPRWVGILYMYD